ncbi:MAG: hypothetical protein HKM95_02175 [Inquilinus sp.]|nr:hypothetical protein [Inquilinus sp.]
MVPTVLELLADPAADLEAQRRRHRHIAGILLVIYIGPESEGVVVLLIVIAIAVGILGGLVAKAAYRFVARNRS